MECLHICLKQRFIVICFKAIGVHTATGCKEHVPSFHFFFENMNTKKEQNSFFKNIPYVCGKHDKCALNVYTHGMEQLYMYSEVKGDMKCFKRT